jgi:hypothetical protein
MEAKQIEGYNSCKSCGTARIKIPTQRISREVHTYFENGNEEPTLTVPMQNAYIDTIPRTVVPSNSFLQTDTALIASTASGNTAIEGTVGQYLNDISTQHASTDTEADKPEDNYAFNVTSAYEPGAGNVSAVAEGDDAHVVDDSATFPTINTSTTTLPNACSYPCNGQDQYGHSWTGCPGYYVNRPCPNGALGESKWFCDSYGNTFIGDTPDYGNCTHMWIEEVHEEVSCSCHFNGTNIRAPRRLVNKNILTLYY